MIDFSIARKIAGQELGYRNLSGMRTNTPGSYFFHGRGGHSLLVMDDRGLRPRDRKDLSVFLAPGSDGTITGLYRKILEIPLKGKGTSDTNDRTDKDIVPIWYFLDDSWCLAHIYTGCRIGTLSDREALQIYEQSRATSNHDRAAAMRALARAAHPHR